MLTNYLKTAFRTFARSPIYSLINIVGLAVGISCCLLIIVYLKYQFSFDDFHAKADRIFRLNKVVASTAGAAGQHAITSGPMGPQIRTDFPEVEQTVRVLPWFDGVLLGHEENRLKVEQFVLVDAGFFDLFDFQLLAGDAATALVQPLSVVLSERVAQSLFGEADAIGQIVRGLDDLDYTVTGIVENAPDNSHLQYDALVSWSSINPAALNQDWLERWQPQAVYTYLLLNSPQNAGALESKLEGFMQRHFPERAEDYQLYLQPLSEVYLQSTDIQYDDTVKSGSFTNVAIFSVVAGLILLIACINYMNLSTAQSLNRAREVGMRKVLGALRSQLSWQFLGESVLLSLIAMLLSLEITRVGFNLLSSFGIPEEALSLAAHPEMLTLLLGITVTTGLIAGSYPALVLSAFKPVSILRGQFRGHWSGDELFRKILVMLQFSLSTALIIGTVVIFNQMTFINNKDLGFDKEDILVLQLGGTRIMGQEATFREELLRNPDILQVTHSNSVPGSGFMSMQIIPEGSSVDEGRVSNIMRVGDGRLLDTFGMEMAMGRYFSEELTSDSASVVINETMARELGWQNPVGRRMEVPGEVPDGTVIGVIRDFHTGSLHRTVDPLLLYQDTSGSFLSLKIRPQNVDETVAFVTETWRQFDPEFPVEYFFLDENFAEFYSAEQNTLQVMLIFTSLAIFLACLGLFGLSTFMAQQRRREIGIRKVLGSSVSAIVALLSADFLKLVGTGFILAILPTWWFAGRWLEGFFYRIELSATVFAAAGLAALLLAFMAVLWQSVRAANRNPVESLRCE